MAKYKFLKNILGFYDYFKKLTKAQIIKIKLHLKEWLEELNTVEAKQKGISTTILVDKIFLFCELYSGIKFYPYQEQFGKRIIRSVLENDGLELTALFARQMGKSETVATILGGLMIILPKMANLPMFIADKRFKMFRDGLWIGIFAPSLRQAQNTYNRMKTRLQSDMAMEVLADPDFGYNFDTSNGQTVAISNGSFATAVSASDGSNIEGDSYKLIVCEECQDISNFKIRKSIHPMGASYNATIVKIGTSTTFKGDFYEAIERNKRDFKSNKLKVRSHFEYDYIIGSKYNPKYRAYVEKEKYRLGENSDEFRMSYKLEWILERGMFVSIDFLEKNCGDTSKRLVKSDLKKSHVIGIDLAKKSDSTVITVIEVDWNNPVILEKNNDDVTGEDSYIAYETLIKDWKELDGDDYDTQYYEILDYIKHFNVKRIMIDATKEEGMCDRLRANLNNIEVVSCVFSSGFKSIMYKHLDSEIRTGRAKIPMDEDTKKTREYNNFIQQMGDLQKEYKGQVLHVNHPPERGAHDDYCLSLDTEILTQRGFLSYKELKEDDLVARVEDNKIIYVKPLEIIIKNYKGFMYNFKSKDLDLMVTKNHKMLTRNRKSGKEVVNLSQELANINLNTLYNTRSIPVAPKQLGKEVNISDDLIKQICWFITDGRINKGIHRIPRNWLSNFSQRQLKLVLDTLMLGGGTCLRNTYSTNNLGLAQDFQELAHKLGIRTSIRQNKNKMYNCYMRNKDETRIKEVRKSLYTGKVWCVNVNNGFIVVRRNNKIAITGNCDSWGLAVLGARVACENQTIEVEDTNPLFKKTQQTFYNKRNNITARRR